MVSVVVSCAQFVNLYYIAQSDPKSVAAVRGAALAYLLLDDQKKAAEASATAAAAAADGDSVSAQAYS